MPLPQVHRAPTSSIEAPAAISDPPHPPGVLLVRRIPVFEPPAGAVTRTFPTRVPRTAPGSGTGPTPQHPVDPAAHAGARRVLQLSLEVLDGRRSPAQLRSLLPERLVEKVRTAARTRVARPGGAPPATLGPVRVQQITPDVAETFTIVRRGSRVGAAVARMERSAQGWRCTALRVG